MAVVVVIDHYQDQLLFTQSNACVCYSIIIHNTTLGNYENMDVSKLPQLWLAYLSDPSDSGES